MSWPLKKHGRPTVSIAARVQEKWFVQCRITEPEVVVIDGANALGKGWVLCSAGNMHRPKADLLFFKTASTFKIIQMGAFQVKR